MLCIVNLYRIIYINYPPFVIDTALQIYDRMVKIVNAHAPHLLNDSQKQHKDGAMYDTIVEYLSNYWDNANFVAARHLACNDPA